MDGASTEVAPEEVMMGLMGFVKPTDPLEWSTSFTLAGAPGESPVKGTASGGFQGSYPPDRRIPLIGAIQQAVSRLAESDPEALRRASAEPASLGGPLTQQVAGDLQLHGAQGQVTVVGVRLDAPQPAAPAPPELTLEQYASLCVERTRAPGQEAAVAQRYYVPTMEALAALDTRWQQRLQSEPGLQQRWQQACASYDAWLRSQGR